MKRAAFLDRDGTLIADKGYLIEPDGVELLSVVPVWQRLADTSSPE